MVRCSCSIQAAIYRNRRRKESTAGLSRTQTREKLIFRTSASTRPSITYSLSICISFAQNEKIVRAAWRVGKDVIETGTNFVPAAVPRPVARVSVAVVAVTVALFLLKSFLSTAFFVLAMMALIYFVFVAFNTDEVSGSSGGSGSTTSTEETLEEARRIMEKYK